MKIGGIIFGLEIMWMGRPPLRKNPFLLKLYYQSLQGINYFQLINRRVVYSHTIFSIHSKINVKQQALRTVHCMYLLLTFSTFIHGSLCTENWINRLE